MLSDSHLALFQSQTYYLPLTSCPCKFLCLIAKFLALFSHSLIRKEASITGSHLEYQFGASAVANPLYILDGREGSFKSILYLHTAKYSLYQCLFVTKHTHRCTIQKLLASC